MSDDPTEHAQEHIHHEAAHGHGPKWITAAALTAAFLAAFAAVSSSLATSHLTQSTLKRIAANDQWNYYQAKSIKNSIIDSSLAAYALLEPGKIPSAMEKKHEDDLAKKKEYNLPADQEKNPAKPKGMPGIQNLAGSLEDISGAHLEAHETYETSATMFHIAIAIVAIAVVAKRKEFWYISMIGGIIGIYFFGTAFALAPAAEHKQAEAAETAAHSPAAEHKTTDEKKPAPIEEHH